MDKIEERQLELEEKMAEMRFQLEFQKQMFTTLVTLFSRQGSTTNGTAAPSHGVQQNHPMFGVSMDMPPESSCSHGMYHF